MKKEKQPSAAKAARKSIHERLVKELKTITAGLQKQGINSIIDIEKEAKKLAKKITKGAKVDHPAAPEAVKEKPVAVDAKQPVKEKAPVKPTPAPKSPDAKVAKPIVPVVTPEPAAAKPKAVKAASQPKTGKK